MSSVRQDYILRLIDELRQFVTAVLHSGGKGGLEEALVAVLQAQEKLFNRPIAEIGLLELEDQLRLLGAGESPTAAREKLRAYAALLREAARVYRARDQEAIAVGAENTAHYIEEKVTAT